MQTTAERLETGDHVPGLGTITSFKRISHDGTVRITFDWSRVRRYRPERPVTTGPAPELSEKERACLDLQALFANA